MTEASPAGTGSPDPEDHDGAALDSATLATLRAVLESDLAAVIEAYLEEAPQLIADARIADAEGDRERLRACAHSLKSSSANVGALRLSERARTLESIAIAGEATVVKSRLADLQSEYARVDIALQKLV